MKKKIGALLLVFTVMIMAIGFAGCSDGPEYFGLFAVAGRRLTSFVRSSNSVSASQIPGLINAPNWFRSSDADPQSAEDEENQVSILPLGAINTSGSSFMEAGIVFDPNIDAVVFQDKHYAGINVNVRSWFSNDRNKLEVEDFFLQVTGLTFRSTIQNNTLFLNENVRLVNLLISDGFESWALASNTDFRARPDYTVRPQGINDQFEFFRITLDGQNVLAVRSNAYVEIPAASLIGGSTNQFVQQIEAIYDSTGKMIRYQSSLGIVLNSARGTEFLGTNFEVDIEWLSR